MAPVIFINNADSIAANIFTLAHELAHLWIGQGGISDADPTIAEPASPDIESFCNRVAAELLLPWSRISDLWRNREVQVPEWIRRVSLEFHVSTVMAAKQLWVHDAITREQFFDLYNQARDKWTAAQQQSTGGNYYLSVPIRNSRTLTEALLESVDSRETLIREASSLLGVKPVNFRKLKDSLALP